MKTHTLKFSKMNLKIAAPQMFRAARGESGAILIMAMLLMIVITLLVVGVTRMTTGDFARVADYEDSRRAFYITEAGIESAKALIRTQNFDDFLLGPDGASGTSAADADNGLLHDGSADPGPGGTALGSAVTINGVKYSQVSYDNGTYSVRVFDNQDEVANDPYSDTDNILVIESIGVTSDGSQERIIAAVRKYNLPPSEFPAAVTLVGPAANIAATGGISVDGGTVNYGWDLKGYAVHTGPPAGRKPDEDTDCAPQHAISTEDTAWVYEATDWAANTENQFNGKGNPATVNDGLPDVGTAQTAFTAHDAAVMASELAPFCANCFTGNPQGSGGLAFSLNNSSGEDADGNTILGTPDEPVITYIDGNVMISGDQKGAGVLIIDGDLNIVGIFDWAGVILVGSCATCWGQLGSAGTSKIYGAMVVGNSNTAVFDSSGTANIYYSCDGVVLAADVFENTFKEIGWHESD